ncbi:MAG: HlyD family efflux transporter periplasmic adaptor subunit [Novosphingobium sp.]|uniref:HlyD family efflux transporter periplasmic adaptor subunit n=1 Tax=Novosphingobium sp. TaxID=1874826 RepID=UPI0022C8826A|nr:HlyD family efflux transporter periplasmic adaptor subunit [Novosphingobium sp.]MCZ8036379.1 HlyD family efflux transporter periplasmic adaptor subunit [Novosphingobium sp.]
MLDIVTDQPAFRTSFVADRPKTVPDEPTTRPLLPPPRQKRGRVVVPVLVFVAAAAASGALYWSTQSKPASSHAPIEVAPPAVVGLGAIEPVSAIIAIAAPVSPDTARIAELKIGEGDIVARGQILAVLDTALKLRAQVAAAEAQVALRQLALQRSARDLDYTTEQRRAALERARAELDTSKAEYDRQQDLAERSVATASNLEKKRRDLAVATATVREMEAAVRQSEARTEAPALEPIDLAYARLELRSSEAELGVAKASLEQAYLRAPSDGRVFRLLARAGEKIGADGLLEFGDTRHMRAVVEVYQTDADRVRLGQHVLLMADSLREPLDGRVTWIGAIVKRQSVTNNDPATATDARVITVHVGLDEAGSARVADLSRLQVRARFVP